MTTARAQPLTASELTKAHEGSPWVTMARTPEIAHLIEDCWQQLFKLHKSLAALKKINAQGWEFLNQAFQFQPTANAIRPASIDSAIWRKRAEEARSLVDTMRTAEAKRSLAEIADAYEALASSQADPK
ncbi:MAG: hypothetical protein WCF79_23925 [Rhodomicrobium sp.]